MTIQRVLESFLAGFGKIDDSSLRPDVSSLRPKGEPTRPQVQQFRQLAVNATKVQKFSPRDMRVPTQARLSVWFVARLGSKTPVLQAMNNGRGASGASLPVISFMAGEFSKVAHPFSALHASAQ